MNKNYKQLIEYFKDRDALSIEKATDIDNLQIDNLSREELIKMLNLMSTEFHQTEEGKFYYKSEPALTRKQIIEIIISFLMLTAIFVVFNLLRK